MADINLQGSGSINQPSLSVSTAPTQPSLSVSSSPQSSTGTYNPQGQPSTPIQPAATSSSILPQSIQGSDLQPGLNPGVSNSFKFMDGSVVDGQGNLISGPTTSQPPQTTNGGNVSASTAGYVPAIPGQVQTTSNGTGLNTPTPNPTQDSTSLTNDTTYSDIMSLLNTNLSNMDKLFANMQAYSTVSPQEQGQQQVVASDQAGLQALGYQEQGLYNPGNQAIALPFLTGQAQNKMVTAGIQAQLDQSVLNYMQGNRQFAFNSAAQIFSAAQNNLQNMLDVYTKMAPQNIGTNYNPTTGQLTAIMRNPISGATYTGNLGNIGAQHSFTSTNIQQDPLSGALMFVGTTSDGQVVTQPIGAGSSFTQPSISQPLQGGGTSIQGGNASGNYTQTTTPQVSSAGGLLANWTSGGQTMPGNGYQNAVYSTFQQQTGIPINAQTPTSTLVSNIPALTQGIIKAENISPSLVAATNNPTGILYANQPNAVPYTDPGNGYTYAKFPTYQDGVNAANQLLATKLGASQDANGASNVSPNLSQAVQTLPPALQGAVHYLPDGTPFFNANQLTSAQIPMAQAAATRTGIPYINGTNADKLDDISVALQNLNDLNSFAQQTNGGGFFGKVGNILKNSGANSFFGSTKGTTFDSYRQLAIGSLQALVGGTGSGLRITAGEIASQQNNIPGKSDTPGQAQTKTTALTSQLNKWISQIIPGWNPTPGSINTTSSPSGNVDYSATLNNLAQMLQ